MINRIEQLIIIATANCNSKCIHCSYWKNKKQNYLHEEIIFKTILKLKKYGLKSVMISGGEPFLHPDINEIVKFISKNKLRIKFATNGIIINNLDKEIIGMIDDFSISLDSSNKETYSKIRGIDNFENILRNIFLLKKLKKNVKLSFLIQKQNYQEIPAFLDLCDQLEIKDISFLVPNKEGDFNKNCYENYDDIVLSNKDITKFKEKILPKIKIKLKKYKIKSNYIENNLIEIANYFKCFNKNFKCDPIRCTKCSFPINNVVLTECGKLKPCLFMPYEFENSLIKNNDLKKIKYFKNDYLFKKDVFDKHCTFCLEVPL